MIAQMQTLALILAFTAALLVIAYIICLMGDRYTTQSNGEAVAKLRLQGVIYVGKNDKATDCYRHTETNAVYYKIGIQWRNANNGRIVSNENAQNGTY